jgi:hypothetical protein
MFMNKFLTILVMLAVVCSAVSAKNIDDPKATTGMAVVKSGSVFKVYYRGLKPANVKVTILNEQGKAVYKETLKNIESFVRPYNFSTLNEGNYTIEIENDDGKQLKSIEHVTKDQERLMSLVRMRGSENKFVLSVANKGNDVLKVKILDGKENIVYSGTEEIEGDFARIYTLKSLNKDFQFVVTDKSGHTQSIQYSK